ncbi:hypothetical protein LCGC14_1757860 [marine sediment metagenome]|uniref:Uncharacterized protein n=1 Tax=marine sediment metagenome TaxID=412755 RepID=A0A0F9K1I9_9ZZZZ|nr:hypothetical protein [Candidatus Aminicenantes bacterium]
MDLRQVAKEVVKDLNNFENRSSAVDKISHGHTNNQIEIVYKRLLEKKVKELLKEDKMKKKIIMKKENVLTVNFEDIDEYEPIFSKVRGKFNGMIMLENLRKCLESGEACGYEFYVN